MSDIERGKWQLFSWDRNSVHRMSVVTLGQVFCAENVSCQSGTSLLCRKWQLSNRDRNSLHKMSFVQLGQDFRAQNVSFLTLANDFIETTFRYDIIYTAEQPFLSHKSFTHVLSWLQISTANESRPDSDNTRVSGLCQQSGQRLKSMSAFLHFLIFL